MSNGMTREDWAATVEKVMPFASKAKGQMLKAKVARARKTCPECGGTVHFALAGYRNHLHMACETPDCIMRMME